MAYQEKTPAYIKLDERNHVEKPLLDQLAGLGWEIIDLDGSQTPAQSLRGSFAEVVLESVFSFPRASVGTPSDRASGSGRQLSLWN